MAPSAVPLSASELTAIRRWPGKFPSDALDLGRHQRISADTAAKHDQARIEHADATGRQPADIGCVARDSPNGRSRPGHCPREKFLGRVWRLALPGRPVQSATVDKGSRAEIMFQPFAIRRFAGRPGKRHSADFAGGTAGAAKQATFGDEAETDPHADLQKGECLVALSGAKMHLADGRAIDVVFENDRHLDLRRSARTTASGPSPWSFEATRRRRCAAPPPQCCAGRENSWPPWPWWPAPPTARRRRLRRAACFGFRDRLFRPTPASGRPSNRRRPAPGRRRHRYRSHSPRPGRCRRSSPYGRWRRAPVPREATRPSALSSDTAADMVGFDRSSMAPSFGRVTGPCAASTRSTARALSVRLGISRMPPSLCRSFPALKS